MAKTVKDKIKELRIPVVAGKNVTIRLTKQAKEQTKCKKGKVYKTDIFNIEFLFKNGFIPFEEAVKEEAVKKENNKNKNQDKNKNIEENINNK